MPLLARNEGNKTEKTDRGSANVDISVQNSLPLEDTTAPKLEEALSQQGKMIETSFKNSQIQNFKLYKIGDALLLGYAPLIGTIRYLTTV